LGGGSYVRVLVDSNFLIAPFLLGWDVFSELGRVIGGRYEVIVLDRVIDELMKLAEKGGRRGKLARAALSLVEVRGFRVCPSGVEGGGVDDAVFDYAKREGCVVATNDAKLRRRLRRVGVPVVFLRQGRRLFLDGEIL